MSFWTLTKIQVSKITGSVFTIPTKFWLFRNFLHLNVCSENWCKYRYDNKLAIGTRVVLYVHIPHVNRTFYSVNYEYPLWSYVAIYEINFHSRKNKTKIWKYCLSIDGTVGIYSVCWQLSVCIFIISNFTNYGCVH